MIVVKIWIRKWCCMKKWSVFKTFISTVVESILSTFFYRKRELIERVNFLEKVFEKKRKEKKRKESWINKKGKF